MQQHQKDLLISVFAAVLITGVEAAAFFWGGHGWQIAGAVWYICGVVAFFAAMLTNLPDRSRAQDWSGSLMAYVLGVIGLAFMPIRGWKFYKAVKAA
ncbi:MAG TPA: hypothetical protein VFT49_00800 [Candidatus Saccharimonadales bacterium]|nr:hypothetical protein [Candidatus Saccharimonadales bacterium]